MIKYENNWTDAWQSLDGKEIPDSTILAPEFLALLHHDWLTIDVGCGSGRTTRELSKKCDRVVGIDINRNALSLTHWFSNKNPSIYYAEANATELPFSSGTFDCATLLGVLGGNELSHRARILRETRRVLKKGALVYVMLQSFVE